jgi:hypothetical protein
LRGLDLTCRADVSGNIAPIAIPVTAMPTAATPAAVASRRAGRPIRPVPSAATSRHSALARRARRLVKRSDEI